jgi:hypothetical protein
MSQHIVSNSVSSHLINKVITKDRKEVVRAVDLFVYSLIFRSHQSHCASIRSTGLSEVIGMRSTRL